MKKSELRKIIKEEIQNIQKEGWDNPKLSDEEKQDNLAFKKYCQNNVPPDFGLNFGSPTSIEVTLSKLFRKKYLTKDKINTWKFSKNPNEQQIYKGLGNYLKKINVDINNLKLNDSTYDTFKDED